METPRNLDRLFGRLAEALKGIAGKLRREKPPAMIGTPPSRRPPIPVDPAEHAVQFAHEWANVADSYVQKRMHELGIPEHQIGAIEYGQGGIRRAFEPHERRGGTNDVFSRLYVDSGVLNPELNAEQFGPHVSSVWSKSRLRDRIDAVIAHEHTEVETGSHDSAEALAPDTALPIREGGRRILRAIAGRHKP
jgi:hypothetical protein